MAGREVDWRRFIDSLVFCFGCGRFGRPRKGRPPFNWKLLYQPHGGGPAGLLVCSSKCDAEVREVMVDRVITEPLRVSKAPMMDAELRAAMLAELKEEMAEKIGDAPDTRFVFVCEGETCTARINPMTPHGIPTIFFCPKCGTKYRAAATGIAGKVNFRVMEKDELDDNAIPGPVGEDPNRGDAPRGSDGDGDDPDLRPPNALRLVERVPPADDEEDVVESDRGGAAVVPERVDEREGPPETRGDDLG